MRGLITWMVGAPLTVLLLTAPIAGAADTNGEVRYWSNGRVVTVAEPATATVNGRVVTVAQPGVAIVPGVRVFHVNDMPDYDLSGAGDFLYLVDDGTTYRVEAWRSPTVAAYAGANGVPRAVSNIPAEYRQNWLAVAAGDRPVRCLTTPQTTRVIDGMAMVPTSFVYVSGNGAHRNGNGASYTTAKKKAVTQRRATAARYASMKKRHATQARYSYTQEPAVTATTNGASAATNGGVNYFRDEAGRDLYQVGKSWYTMEGGAWLRSESWRGPFIEVKKGSVPREVRTIPPTPRSSSYYSARAEMDMD